MSDSDWVGKIERFLSTRRRDCAFTWQKKDTDTSMLASLGFRRIDLNPEFINWELN